MRLVRLWQYQTAQLVCPQQYFNAIDARMDTATKQLQTLHQPRRSPLSCNRNSLAPLIKGRKRAAVCLRQSSCTFASGNNYAHDYIAHEEHLHTGRWRAYFEETISCILIQSLSILSILILLALEVESCTVERMRPNLHIPRKCEQLRANQVDLFWKFCIFVDLLWTICIFVDYVESSWNGRKNTGKVQRLGEGDSNFDKIKSDVICDLTILSVRLFTCVNSLPTCLYTIHNA